MPAFDGLVGMDMRKVLDELRPLFGKELDKLRGLYLAPLAVETEKLTLPVWFWTHVIQYSIRSAQVLVGIQKSAP